MTPAEKRKARRSTPEARKKATAYAKKYRDQDPKAREKQRKYSGRYRELHPEHRERATAQRYALMHDGLGGKIYFMQAVSGPVKIGFTTKRPLGRMEEVQVGNHEELKLLGWHLGSKVDERRLLELFRTDRIRGEWFRVTPKLLEYVQINCVTT